MGWYSRTRREQTADQTMKVTAMPDPGLVVCCSAFLPTVSLSPAVMFQRGGYLLAGVGGDRKGVILHWGCYWGGILGCWCFAAVILLWHLSMFFRSHPSDRRICALACEVDVLAHMSLEPL